MNQQYQLTIATSTQIIAFETSNIIYRYNSLSTYTEILQLLLKCVIVVVYIVVE